MGVGAEDRDAVATTRQHVGRGSATRDVAGARHGEAAIGALGTAQAELGDGTALCRLDHAGGLGGDQRLKVDGVEQRGLEQLALKGGARHAHHGFSRKDQLALGHRIDVDVHAEPAQELEEIRVEHLAAAGCGQGGQVVDVLVRETQVLDQFRQLRGAAHDGERVAKGAIAVERGEAALLLELAVLP